MNWRTTLALVSAALLSGLFVLTIERPARLARLRHTAAQRLLPQFDPASVHRIRIQPGITPDTAFDLVRTNGQWRLDEPLRRLAQQSLAEALLGRVAQLEGHSILTPQELRDRPQATADFGLAPPTARVSLELASRNLELLLGARSLNGNQVYYQITGLPGIYTADAQLLDHLPLAPQEWRDSTLLPLDGLTFDRLRVVSATGAFSLSRDAGNGLWEMTEPRPARVDSTRVGLLLRQLGLLQINQFLPATSTPPAEVAGLRPAQITLALARGSNEIYRLSFGLPITNAAAPSVYAQRPGEPDTLAVPTEAHDLLRISYKDLLDRRLVRFDRTAVQEIAVSGAEEFRITHQDGAWTLGPGALKADAPLVTRLFGHLAALEMIDIAKEVVTDLDLANYGLAPPSARIELRSRPGDTNAILARLEIGALRDNHTFARVPGEAPVYLLNPADVDELPKTAWDLRDRSLWRFEAAQVVTLTARLDGSEWTLRRQGTNDWSVPPGAKNEVNPFALEEALHRMGQARVAAWRGLGAARAGGLGIGIGKGPEITLELRGQPAPPPLHFRFGKAAPGGRRYAALPQPDGSLPVFEIPAPLFEDLWRECGIAGQSPSAP